MKPYESHLSGRIGIFDDAILPKRGEITKAWVKDDLAACRRIWVKERVAQILGNRVTMVHTSIRDHGYFFGVAITAQSGKRHAVGDAISVINADPSAWLDTTCAKFSAWLDSLA